MFERDTHVIDNGLQIFQEVARVLSRKVAEHDSFEALRWCLESLLGEVFLHFFRAGLRRAHT